MNKSSPRKKTVKKPKWWPKSGAREVIPEIVELEVGYWMSLATEKDKVGGTI